MELSKNIVKQEVEWNQKVWKIIIVYNQDVKETMKIIKEKTEEKNGEALILVGDWNTRTGKEGGLIDEEGEVKRLSKDVIINSEGRKLIEEITDSGWCIVNGDDGHYTYVGERGSTVIDYAIGNLEAIEEVSYFKVGDRTESDHMPLELTIHGERIEKIEDNINEEYSMRDWSEESIEKYHSNCKAWECEEGNVNEMWENLKEKVQEVVPMIKKKRKKWRLGEKRCQDRAWSEKKVFKESTKKLEERKMHQGRVIKRKERVQEMDRRKKKRV